MSVKESTALDQLNKRSRLAFPKRDVLEWNFRRQRRERLRSGRDVVHSMLSGVPGPEPNHQRGGQAPCVRLSAGRAVPQPLHQHWHARRVQQHNDAELDL